MSASAGLSVKHPLAGVARRLCANDHGPLIGGVACGTCWERSIRNDERLVIEFGLERDLPYEPAFVDDIAVERACHGERVELTVAELGAAAGRLRRLGFGPMEIGRRLHITYRVAVQALALADDQDKTGAIKDMSNMTVREVA